MNSRRLALVIVALALGFAVNLTAGETILTFLVDSVISQMMPIPVFLVYAYVICIVFISPYILAGMNFNSFVLVLGPLFYWALAYALGYFAWSRLINKFKEIAHF